MMRAALERADIAPERVGYINAHGTSTPHGDLAETKAIKNVFGDHAYKLAVSSTKSMMGHTFGAAGAIEAIMCILALRDGDPAADDQLRACPTPSAISTTCRTRPVTRRSTSRSRMRWASAATTAACSSGALRASGR